MLSIQARYLTLYTSLAQEYSVAVMNLYPREARDIPRWAAPGLFQLDAVEQAINMIFVLNATDTNMFLPATTREDQQFSTLPAITITPESKRERTPTPAPTPSPSPSAGAPHGNHGHYGPQLKRTPRHMKPPFPTQEYLRAPNAGEAVCESCFNSGHEAEQCRIYDPERLKANGRRKNLQWFDIAKEPRDYQDRLLAHLKAHGPIKDQQGVPGAAFVDKRMEEPRAQLAEDAENKTKDGQGRRGIGFHGRGRGAQGSN